MIDRKTWQEFQACGLLWWINAILHTFGWSVVLVFEDDGVTFIEAYPARVKFRGFDTKQNDDGYLRVTKYLEDNAAKLNEEIQ